MWPQAACCGARAAAERQRPRQQQQRAQRQPQHGAAQAQRCHAAALLPLLLLLSLLLSATIPAHAYTVHLSSAHQHRIAQHVARLPVEGDALSTMDDAERRALGADLKLTIGDTLRAMDAAQALIPVEVRLVGFDGAGAGGVRVDARALEAQLRTLHAQLETVALEPVPRHMAIRPTVEFTVTAADRHLASRVSGAIAAAAAAAPPSKAWSDFGVALISPQAVFEALDADFDAELARRGGRQAYVVYLLNGASASAGGHGGHGGHAAPAASTPYAFAYDDARRSCPGGVLLARARRYAAYDVGANVTFYGPGPGGEGQVLEHSVPALSHYRPEALARAIVPDLAALAFSAARHLVWPPVAHADVGYRARVAVHVVYMHQDLMGAVARLDREGLEAELRDAVKGLGQEVTVTEHWHPFGECPHCVAGFSSALRARTDGGSAADASALSSASSASAPAPSAKMTRYLDGGALRDWAKEWGEAVLTEVGVDASGGGGGGHSGRSVVLPVFVFDADDADAVLIDGWRQAVALPDADAVVAVRSGRRTVPTFFGCHDKQVHIDPQDLQRPVLAALLAAGWGVADTALAWSPATGRSWSWLWSVGPTPFGPLSTSPALSFAQRDAMARNLVVATVNASVGHAALLLHGFAALGGEGARVKDFLPPDLAVPYNQRIALLLWQLQEAMAALSRLDHAAALGYAASLSFDAAALHAVVRRARGALDTSLECLGAEERRRWWALPGGAAIVCIALIAWRLFGPSPAQPAKRHSY